MSELKMSNIPQMNVGALSDLLTDMYASTIKNHLPLKSMPAVMLWGPPGVGKSQAARYPDRKRRQNACRMAEAADL